MGEPNDVEVTTAMGSATNSRGRLMLQQFLGVAFAIGLRRPYSDTGLVASAGGAGAGGAGLLIIGD